MDLRKLILPLAAVVCLLPFIGAGTALVLGMFIAIAFGNPYADFTKKWTHRLLSLSVIGLGAGMNLITVAHTGIKGIGYTAISIVLTMLAGVLLGRLYKVEKNTSVLISVGTAICGGSAIAAVAPVIQAKHHSISVSLGVVFLLNAVALFLFPAIGHFLNLSELQFGLWSALAIQDTSSVVGAGLKYGPIALETGTTIKLARALWIVPMVFAVQAVYNRDAASETGEKPKRKYPWFILGFLLMAAVMTWVPELKPIGHGIEMIARRLLVLTLFLIGTNLTREALRAVGVKPLLQGVTLWLLVAGFSLLVIYFGWIS